MIKTKRLMIFIMSALFAVSLFTSNVPVNAAQNDATLKSLKITGGTLSPSFNKNEPNYSVNVNSNVTSINITASLSNARASFKFKVNDKNEITGKNGKSTKIDLEDITTIKIIITPQAGTETNTYTITVNRAKENDASLAKVALMPSEIGVAAFDADGKCALDTDYIYSSVRIIPSAVDSRAKITINGKTVKSGSQYSASLKTGENVFVINVTNGTGHKIYTLTINRSKNDNVFLKTLTVSPGTMDRKFNKSQLKYVLSLKDTDKKINIVPIAEDSNASIKLSVEHNGISDITPNGNKYEVGVEDGGTYIITIMVTAENGKPADNPYEITVIKPDASDKTLSSIVLSAGEWKEEINPGDIQENIPYKVVVENDISKITLEAKPTNTSAAVKIFLNNKSVGSGKASITLSEGSNEIRIEVYSHDGNKVPKVYAVNIKRVPKPVMNIVAVGYEDKTLPSSKIKVSGDTYTIDLTGLKDTDMVKYVEVDVKYASVIKFQNQKEVSLAEGDNILNDLSAVGLTDTGEPGVSIGILKKNADASGYITVYATLIGEYEGHGISRDIVLKARVKEARKENGINNIVNSMKFNLNNGTSISAIIDKNHNKLTFDFSKIDVTQPDLRVMSGTINVKRDCTLAMGNKSVKLSSGDNTLKLEDFGLVDNGNDGVSIVFLKNFNNISLSGTLIDETAKGSPEYLITFALKW